MAFDLSYGRPVACMHMRISVASARPVLPWRRVTQIQTTAKQIERPVQEIMHAWITIESRYVRSAARATYTT